MYLFTCLKVTDINKKTTTPQPGNIVLPITHCKTTNSYLDLNVYAD